MKAEPVVFRQKLSGMVNTFERMAGVDLTIHDVRGILSTQESSMILPGRFLHNGLYCRRERFERPVWNNRCTFAHISTCPNPSMTSRSPRLDNPFRNW